MDFAQVSKIRLEGKPYDAEVEYLESTGTQYIDTGVSIPSDHNVSMVVDGQFTALTGDWSYCSVVAENTAQRSRFGIGWRTPGTWSYPYGNYGNIVFGTGDTSRHTFRLNAANGTYGIDNATYSCPQTDGWGTDYTVYLFASNNWGTAASFASMRIYGAKFYKNGVLVRDFIPVRKNGIGYLFDKVSGQLFGNQGTGAFLYGSDVRCYSVAKIERGSTTLWKKRPYDAEVEYLDIPVDAWVSVDGEFRQYPWRYEIDVQLFNTGVQQRLVCVQNSGSYPFLYINGAGYPGLAVYDAGGGLHFAGLNNSASINNLNRNKIIIDYKTARGSVNGRESGFTNYTQTGYGVFDNMCFPCVFPYSAYTQYGVRFYRISVIDGEGNIVRDLIPVRLGQVGYLFDKVSGELFGNAGTGSFGYGADLEGSNS